MVCYTIKYLKSEFRIYLRVIFNIIPDDEPSKQQFQNTVGSLFDTVNYNMVLHTT